MRQPEDSWPCPYVLPTAEGPITGYSHALRISTVSPALSCFWQHRCIPCDRTVPSLPRLLPSRVMLLCLLGPPRADNEQARTITQAQNLVRRAGPCLPMPLNIHVPILPTWALSAGQRLRAPTHMVQSSQQAPKAPPRPQAAWPACSSTCITTPSNPPLTWAGPGCSCVAPRLPSAPAPWQHWWQAAAAWRSAAALWRCASALDPPAGAEGS